MSVIAFTLILIAACIIEGAPIAAMTMIACAAGCVRIEKNRLRRYQHRRRQPKPSKVLGCGCPASPSYNSQGD